MSNVIRIGTRDSKLALWQAETVQSLLKDKNIDSELIPVKSEGDLDLITPLYAMGVEGVFTKTLDAYLLSNKIDVAVHSMKDVPTQLAQGIAQGAVLKRANHKDLFVYKNKAVYEKYFHSNADEQRLLQGVVATGSVRRKAQLLHKFPNLTVENLRGNVQTRMKKLHENNWDAAIFAAAGLERIDERPQTSVEMDWMLPAPAQGAIMIVCRENDKEAFEKINSLNDEQTALCVKIERDFLKTLMGGCSTPISALAEIVDDTMVFKGNILSPDGKQKVETEKEIIASNADELGILAAKELLRNGADEIVKAIKNA
ncbi:hydroxymethylbilane synthase [Arachidicoccus ginsenosidimutans]|uniref:hydroxymethylbilane synthase n=1 Tax=Arachidicoccus sp. BS20 TaxID=1850526 RepID=UPI0007F12D71|nr:hydroxymethylbilane synthase [Arachidicoccus sp. BS20]ANI89421.1 hydroxymethylbilane synthase [Arachidicoccus sp. BS20]